jgi:hypothetical protein
VRWASDGARRPVNTFEPNFDGGMHEIVMVEASGLLGRRRIRGPAGSGVHGVPQWEDVRAVRDRRNGNGLSGQSDDSGFPWRAGDDESGHAEHWRPEHWNDGHR